MKGVVDPLLIARNQPGATADVYELMMTIWLHTSATPDIEQLKIADEAVRRFSRNTNLIHDAAVLMHRGGRTADAAMIVKYGLSVARTDDIRARFTKLQEALRQR